MVARHSAAAPLYFSPTALPENAPAKRPRTTMNTIGGEDDAIAVQNVPVTAHRFPTMHFLPLAIAATSVRKEPSRTPTYARLAAKRLRTAVSMSVPPSKRLRTDSAIPSFTVLDACAISFSALPPPKRRRVAGTGLPPSPTETKRQSERLPSLPADVWHQVAGLLPAASLTALSETSSQHRCYATPARNRLLWTSLYGTTPSLSQATEVPALLSLMTLLDGTPSLRHKRVCSQLAGLAVGRSPPGDATVHFTEAQAVAFLGVEPAVLRRYAPARVRAGAPRARRKLTHALALFPPDGGRRADRVFALPAVLRAARASRGGFERVGEAVGKAVLEDEERFARAERAEREVQQVARECGAPVREVEYLLSASGGVTEFRQGRWSGGVEGYVGEVWELFRVHQGLGGCYRCLLICDGNARLKAKRIVGKILKGCRRFSTQEVVRALEGNLWWARSKSNVQKMEEMSRNMPHIRV